MVDIRLDIETADRITVDNLKEAYVDLKKQNVVLKERGKLKPHQQEDFDNNLAYMNSILGTLEYYMPRDDYNSWLNSIE